MPNNIILGYFILLFCYKIVGQILDEAPTIFEDKNVELKLQYNNGMQLPNDEPLKKNQFFINSSNPMKLQTRRNSHSIIRDEIKEVTENTIQDFQKTANSEVQPNGIRPLMLVLPFNSVSTDNLQELYNRTPITKIIPNTSILKQPKPLEQRTVSIKNFEKKTVAEYVSPTTYKPTFYTKGLEKSISITTYRPIISRDVIKNYFMKNKKFSQLSSKSNLYSSHYNSENSDIISSRFGPYVLQKQLQQNAIAEADKTNSLENRRNSTNKIIDTNSKFMLPNFINPLQIRITERKPLLRAKLKSSNDFTAFKPIIIKDNVNLGPEIQKYLYRYRLLQKVDGVHENKFNRTPTSRNVINRRIDLDTDTEISEMKLDNTTTKTLNLENYHQLQKLLRNIEELQKLNKTLNFNSKNDRQKLDSDEKNDEGPNPISPDDNPNINFESKNDIKRQTNSEKELMKISLVSSDDANEESITDSVTDEEPTTEPLTNEKLSSLEDSFGGSENLDPKDEEPLPPPKKNGFYFLADVNKFLEVGQDEDKVVVKFNQKIGDPSRFIPVKIPR